MNRFQRWFLWGSTLATALTGGVYGWMKHLMEPVSEWAVINHPLQPWVLKAHIVVAPVMVFAIGLVTVNHVWALHRAGLPRGRSTGRWAALGFAPLVFSGYLIQAVTLPVVLAALAWLHLGLGLAWTAVMVGHRRAVRRGIRKRRRTLDVLPDPGAATPGPARRGRGGLRVAALQED